MPRLAVDIAICSSHPRGFRLQRRISFIRVPYITSLLFANQQNRQQPAAAKQKILRAPAIALSPFIR
jgi:hypothetical protein